MEKDGTIWTDLYSKPTDSHNYLRFESSHPPHCRKGLPYSQFLRIRRICSRPADYVFHGDQLTDFFLARGYPRDLLDRANHEARLQSRETLLEPKPSSDDQAEVEKVFAITTYHPTYKGFMSTIEKNWDLLGSPSTKTIFESEKVYGTRRPKNLRDHLVQASVNLPKDHPLSPPRTTVANTKCADVRNRRQPCKICPLIDLSGTIRGHSDKRKHSTRINVDCESDNLIYAIECTRCGKHYVGQTMMSIRERMRGHQTDINSRTSTKSVSEHFSEDNGHQGWQDVKIFALEFCKTPKTLGCAALREAVERKWQFKLLSNYPLGLNREDAIPLRRH